jgi:uncharacterized protein YggU (UPF0235/DUF167 family)
MQVSVQVVADAKRERVEERKGGRLKVFVKEEAKQGMANTRVRTLMAAHYHVPAAKVRIIRGHRTPSKIFEINK